MRAVFTLTSAESRRLIAKGVVQLPEFKKAWEEAYVLLAGGTTNAFIAQEILNDDTIRPELCTFGISTDGVLCNTPIESRKMFPNVFLKGEPQKDKTMADAFSDFHKDTIIIKGANAFDAQGHVGVVTSGFDGGTVPRFIGYITSKGLKYIAPVELNKMIPSVAEGSAVVGANKIDISLGADFGMYCLSGAKIFTEIEALKLLFNVDTTLVCKGGVGGNDGAVTLACDGEEEDVKAMVDFLEKCVKGEPEVPGNKGICEICRYPFCKYHGLKGEELPEWMKKKGIER